MYLRSVLLQSLLMRRNCFLLGRSDQDSDKLQLQRIRIFLLTKIRRLRLLTIIQQIVHLLRWGSSNNLSRLKLKNRK